MDQKVLELIAAVVSYVANHGGYVTKTKLLKLVYLFDVEFYRSHRRTFTSFQWKYFHLGPWTREFDPLLEHLLSEGTLLEYVSERSEFDTKFIRSLESVDLRRPFDNYKDEAILKTVLDTWGQSSTGEILDYVYFRTEPMEYGTRSENLDFSKISEELPGSYKRPSSKTSPAEIKALRKKFGEKIAHQNLSTSFQFTPPRYDDEFFAAMDKLDTGNL